MQVKLKRMTSVQPVTVGTGTVSSTSARCDNMAGAALRVVGVTASATLTVWSSSDDATFAALAGADGAAATLTVPTDGGMVAVPDAAFAARYVRFVSGTPLSTAAVTAVVFKS